MRVKARWELDEESTRIAYAKACGEDIIMHLFSANGDKKAVVTKYLSALQKNLMDSVSKNTGLKFFSKEYPNIKRKDIICLLRST